MRPPALAFAAILLLVAPTAFAHVGDAGGLYTVEADGLAITMKPESLVVKAQREEVFNGTVESNASGRYELLRDFTIGIEAAGPGSAPQIATERTDFGFQTRIVFTAPGEWSLHIRVNDTLRRLDMHVYPPSDVWMESTNLRDNFHYANKTVHELLYFREEGTNRLLEPKEPAQGVLESWANGTATDPQTVILATGPMSSVVFEHALPREGWYLLSVASPSHAVGYDTLPPVLFHVAGPFRGDTATAATPGPGLFALFAVAAALALLRRK